MNTSIYLVRHGDYENPRHILPSRMPGVHLSPLGASQIREDGRLLKNKKIAALFSSPVLRTKESARILSGILNLPVIFSKSLMEVYSPGLQGKDQSVTREIEAWGDTFRFPLHISAGGETVSHLYSRMKRAVRRALESHPGESTVFVSHGDPIMVLSILESGRAIDEEHSIHQYGPYVPKGGIIRLDYRDGKCVKAQNVNF